MHAASPGATAGRYPFSVILPKNSQPAIASRAQMMISTSTGLMINAATNTPAMTTPAISAAPMLRGGGALVRAGPAGRPLRWVGRPPRRPGSVGRRVIPDGSVPMVMRPGSRRG